MAKGPDDAAAGKPSSGAAAPKSAPGSPKVEKGAAKEDKEECAWCKYMKGGGCREPFEAWQSCVDGIMGDDMDDAARKAAVDKCSSVTQPLFECMMRHRDYYGPQLAGMGGGGGGGGQDAAAGGSGAEQQGAAAQEAGSVAGGETAAAAPAASK